MTGPTATVVTDTSATARAMSPKRARSTRTPSPWAASSPNSSARSGRPAATVAGSSTSSAARRGTTSSQERLLSEPSSQRVASWASSMRARDSRRFVNETISAAIAMPTRTIR